MKALCDTGAAVSIMDSQTAIELNVALRRDDKQPYGVSGQSLETRGVGKLTFSLANINYDHDFIVVSIPHRRVILGVDFLEKYRATIDLNKKIITLDPSLTKQEILPEILHVHVQERDVILKESISIKPYTTKIVVLHHSRKEEEIFEHAHEGFMTTLSPPERTVLRIMNPTQAWLRIDKGTKVGITRENSTVIQSVDWGTKTSSLSQKNKVESREVNRIEIKNYEKAHIEIREKLKIENVHLSDSEKRQLTKIIEKHAPKVLASSLKTQTSSKTVKHFIDTGVHPVIRQKPYRLTEEKKDIMGKMIDDLEKEGIIQPSVSPWSSPAILVPKPGNKWRLCIDYRKLNEATVKDAHPLPRIEELLDTLACANWFTAMDLLSGFYQIIMDEESIPKTAFTTFKGLYEFLRMPFGLCNAPATFERMMEFVFKTELRNFILVYLDDIMVFSKTFEEHMQHLDIALSRLAQHNLTVKLEKCHFAQKEVEFLGHFIKDQTVTLNTKNLKLITDIKPPSSVKEVQRFLGMVGYYRRFIRNFSTIAAPLYQLTKKNVEFTWSQKCQTSYATLQNSLISKPVLILPDLSKEFIMHTDASMVATGYVLSQKDEKGYEHPVRYGSKRLTDTESRYTTTEREALAIVRAVKDCHIYLIAKPFILYTDHKPLTWFFKITEGTSTKIMRWACKIQQYPIKIVYKAGKTLQNADYLSRVEVNLVQLDRELLADKQAKEPQLRQIRDLLKMSDCPNSNYREYKEAMKKIPAGGYLIRHKLDEFVLTERDTVNLYQDGKLKPVIPLELKYQIIKSYHDAPYDGHLGLNTTISKIRNRYYWPNIPHTVTKYIRECDSCQRNKGNKISSKTLSIPVTGPFHQLCIDAVGPLPITRSGNKFLIVCIDRFTGWPEAFALPSIDSPTVAQTIVREIIFRFGCPKTLLSDRGTNFISLLMKEICKLLGIQKINTSAYHPQTNGLVERFNKSLIEGLRHFTNDKQNNWDEYLSAVLFAYRTAPNDTRRFSPFELMFGRNPILPPDVSLLDHQSEAFWQKDDYYLRLTKKLRQFSEQTKKNVDKAHEALYRREQNKGKKEAVIFNEGDQVLIRRIKKYSPGLIPKLLSKWTGPFEVIQRYGNKSYQLKAQSGQLLKSPVNIERMKEYKSHINMPDIKGNNESTHSPDGIESNQFIPDITDNNKKENDVSPQSYLNNSSSRTEQNSNQLYEIQKIIKRRVRKGIREVLIKWKGYPSSQNSWEPEENVQVLGF